jgi:hypothetical protein
MTPPLFMNRQNRDRAWRDAGKPGCRVSHRNQLIHPNYVADCPDKDAQADNGFGNTRYKTPFAVLYSWTEPLSGTESARGKGASRE